MVAQVQNNSAMPVLDMHYGMHLEKVGKFHVYLQGDIKGLVNDLTITTDINFKAENPQEAPKRVSVFNSFAVAHFICICRLDNKITAQKQNRIDVKIQ
jgi:hypothetical protein